LAYKVGIDQNVDQRQLKRLRKSGIAILYQAHDLEQSFQKVIPQGRAWRIGRSPLGGLDGLADEKYKDLLRELGKAREADVEHLYACYLNETVRDAPYAGHAGDQTIRRPSPPSKEIRSHRHAARVRRCPSRCWPGWPAAWPSCCPQPVRAGRATHHCPGDPPDAVAAVVLDGLSYRRAEPMGGICKTEVGASLDLLLPELAALGRCQPDRPARDRDPLMRAPRSAAPNFNGPEPALIDELSWCFFATWWLLSRPSVRP
jgi:hypothetical protein